MIVAQNSDGQHAGIGNALGWGAYLASSWTWCIGMFLPVLLIRDYGWAAWAVFALPNVIGAAAMGWTVRSADHSRALVAAHGPAMLLFSLVTRAFQWFFAAALVRLAIEGGVAPQVLAPLAAGVLLVRGAARVSGALRWAGVAFLLLSATLFLIGAMLAGWTFPAPAGVDAVSGQLGQLPLLWLGLSCIFGFALCPYLDLTFHRARQETGSRSGVAFGVGFGVFFLTMILITPTYAGLAWALSGTAGVLVAAHIMGQLSFTQEVHDVEASTPAAWTGPLERAKGFGPELLSVAGFLIGPIAFALTVMLPSDSPQAGFETGYRVFMGAYAVLFPAYVWICAMPTWANPRRPTTRAVVAWLVVCTAATPMFMLAFLDGEMWQIGPALVVLLVGRLLVGSPRAA